MNELYEKKLNCPVCNKDFVTYKVRSSKLRIIKRDSDFLTYYEGENPIKYNVFVCPKCGYSAMEKYFNKINESGKQIIKEKVLARWKEKDFSGTRSIKDAINTYKLALYCGQIIELDKLKLGSICLRLGWLYRIDKNEEEFRFIDLAIKLYEEAFYKERLLDNGMDEITLGYLIGELNRRAGYIDKAISWFSRVASMQEIKDNPRIEKLTREQWRIAKEKF